MMNYVDCVILILSKKAKMQVNRVKKEIPVAPNAATIFQDGDDC